MKVCISEKILTTFIDHLLAFIGYHFWQTAVVPDVRFFCHSRGKTCIGDNRWMVEMVQFVKLSNKPPVNPGAPKSQNFRRSPYDIPGCSILYSWFRRIKFSLFSFRCYKLTTTNLHTFHLSYIWYLEAVQIYLFKLKQCYLIQQYIPMAYNFYVIFLSVCLCTTHDFFYRLSMYTNSCHCKYYFILS